MTEPKISDSTFVGKGKPLLVAKDDGTILINYPLKLTPLFPDDRTHFDIQGYRFEIQREEL